MRLDAITFTDNLPSTITVTLTVAEAAYVAELTGSQSAHYGDGVEGYLARANGAPQ